MRITKSLLVTLTCLLILSITNVLGKNKCKMRIFTPSIYEMIDGKHIYSCKFYNEDQHFWKSTSKNLQPFKPNICNTLDDNGFILTRCSIELPNPQKITCVSKPGTNNITLTSVNETLEIDCVSQGIGNCSWKRNDQFLLIATRYEHIDGEQCSLRINNIRNTDEGIWQCIKPDGNENDKEIEKFYLKNFFRNDSIAANSTFISNNTKVTTTAASTTAILTTVKKPDDVIIISITFQTRLIIYLAVSICVNMALIATVIVVCLKNKKLKAIDNFVPKNYSTLSNNYYEIVDNNYDSHYLEPIPPSSINRRSDDGRPPLPRPPSLQENRRLSLHSSSESVAVNRNLRLQKKTIVPKDTSGTLTQISEQQAKAGQNSYSNLPPL